MQITEQNFLFSVITFMKICFKSNSNCILRIIWISLHYLLIRVCSWCFDTILYIINFNSMSEVVQRLSCLRRLASQWPKVTCKERDALNTNGIFVPNEYNCFLNLIISNVELLHGKPSLHQNTPTKVIILTTAALVSEITKL